MIHIDGSQGEGGGQIVRTALACSVVTGQPFTINDVRGKRARPGILRQHLTCVRAAATISGAQVRGDEVGSSTLEFAPGTSVTGGDLQFAVGTAGSTTLVAQTVLPALWARNASARLTVEGGTHNPAAPPSDFLVQSWLPLMNQIGFRTRLSLDAHGFAPAGGGRIVVDCESRNGTSPLQALELTERGEVLNRSLVAKLSNLSAKIGHRELHVANRSADHEFDQTQVEACTSPGPGNALLATVKCEHMTAVFCEFGERRVSAEQVAKQLVRRLRAWERSGAAVPYFLADQLLLPMALANGGVFTTIQPSQHTLTNAEVVQRFLDVKIAFREYLNGRFEVTVQPS